MRKKRNHTTVLLILVLLVGLSLLLYPSVSDYWNSFHATKAIASYAEEVAHLDHDQYDQLWADARAYNEDLAGREHQYRLDETLLQRYNELLNLSGVGVMGYVEVPAIRCSLPVYHGTDESVLQIAVGHLEWTSLPTGGPGTHCVLSGHRGLPSAKLFSDLDKVVVGDVFMLRVLDEVLTYEVDQILIVKPHEVDSLQVEAEQDLCTLVTCTPYGVNSHRLLVRGHRIETVENSTVRVTADAVQIEPLLVAPVVAIPPLLILLVGLLLPKRTKYKHGGEEGEV